MKIFNTIRQAEEHAAYQVACFWLASANRIIERGESPCKLSVCARELSRDEIDRDIYRPFNLRGKMETSNIARDAIQIALAKLIDGQFPKVKYHFEFGQTSQDSKQFAVVCLTRIGEM